MATRFEALDELFDDALELPVKGRDGKVRTYRIASPSAEDGLRIQKITALATRLLSGGDAGASDAELLNDDEERDLISDALGTAETEMLADGVDWAWRKHAGLTAVIWITQDADTAKQYWQAAGDPTRLAAPNREERRAKSNGSAGVAKTPKRASTSGTSARPAGKTARKASPA